MMRHLLLLIAIGSGCRSNTLEPSYASSGPGSGPPLHTCQDPAEVQLDRDPSPEWAIVCSDSRTDETVLKILDSGEENPLLYEGAPLAIGEEIVELGGADIDGDRIDEVFVIRRFADDQERINEDLDVLARREGLFVDLWDVEAGADGARRAYEIADGDRDGRPDIVTFLSDGDAPVSVLSWAWDGTSRFVLIGP